MMRTDNNKEKNEKKIGARILKFVLTCFVFIFIFASVLCTGMYMYANATFIVPAKEIAENSTKDDFKLQKITTIYDSNKKVIARLSADSVKNIVYIEFDEIPNSVINAFISMVVS